MARDDIDVHLTHESLQAILTCEAVSDAVYSIATQLEAKANAMRDHPEEGEMYVARRSDGPRRARAQVVPANARTAAHDNKHNTLVKVMHGGIG